MCSCVPLVPSSRSVLSCVFLVFRALILFLSGKHRKKMPGSAVDFIHTS